MKRINNQQGGQHDHPQGGGHERIPWHSAFIEALQLELEAYHDALEFLPEFPLINEPLKIDCVIIKKTKDVHIRKNIAAIFREWNILEYKSPTTNRTA